MVLAPNFISGGQDWATSLWDYWVDYLKVTYPIAADMDHTLAKLQHGGTPAYLLVDLATMKIVLKQVGFHHELRTQLGL